jgi:hypothetical protein
MCVLVECGWEGANIVWHMDEAWKVICSIMYDLKNIRLTEGIIP